MRELRQQLEKDPQVVCLEEFPIHCITDLVKDWLRELPEPLTMFRHCSAFLHAMELPEKSKLRHIYQVPDMLLSVNISMLERLIFHMVRVASEEATNRISMHSLGIFFTPSILCCPDTLNPIEIMKDMRKITMCLELILNEEMRRYEELKEGEQLDMLKPWSAGAS